jgi:hypothetical protein
MTSHMKPTPTIVLAKVRRLGWRAWASGRMSEGIEIAGLDPAGQAVWFVPR